MCEQKSADTSAPTASDLRGLELLYDYTKFHIGVYLTLTAAYITLATSTAYWMPKIHSTFATIAVIAFVVAGAGGGMVASNLPGCMCKSVAKYMETRLVISWWGLWRRKEKPDTYGQTLTAGTWAGIEHGAFWVGIVAAILSFAVPAFFQRTPWG